MPKIITNTKIVKLINHNVKALESINAEQLELNKRIDKLGKDNQKFVDMMNEEYGWGNWNGVDARALTFIPKEEYEKAYYIIQNPAVRDKVETDDIQLAERTITNDPELCARIDELINEQKQAGKVN